MAKYEKEIDGDFTEFLNYVQNEITNGSLSVSYEDGSNIIMDGVRIAVRVFERYSFIGANRVSLSLTLVGVGNKLFLSAITSGGSQAVFNKMNTIGERSFMKLCKDCVERYISPKNMQY